MLFLHSLRLWNLWDVFFFIPTCKHANSRSHKFKALLEKSRQLFFCFFSCYVQFFRFGFVTFPHASSRLHMEEEKHIELEMEPTPWAGSGYWLLAPAIAAYLAACFWKLYLIFWGGTLWFFLCFMPHVLLHFSLVHVFANDSHFQLVFQLGCLGCCSLACQLVG